MMLSLNYSKIEDTSTRLLIVSELDRRRRLIEYTMSANGFSVPFFGILR